ncbi:MAG: hypothetical protein RIE52_11965 [Balneola sp.]
MIDTAKKIIKEELGKHSGSIIKSIETKEKYLSLAKEYRELRDQGKSKEEAQTILSEKYKLDTSTITRVKSEYRN